MWPMGWGEDEGTYMGEDMKMVAAVKSARWGGDGGDDRGALAEVAVYIGLQNFEKHRKRRV